MNLREGQPGAVLDQASSLSMQSTKVTAHIAVKQLFLHALLDPLDDGVLVEEGDLMLGWKNTHLHSEGQC